MKYNRDALPQAAMVCSDKYRWALTITNPRALTQCIDRCRSTKGWIRHILVVHNVITVLCQPLYSLLFEVQRCHLRNTLVIFACKCSRGLRVNKREHITTEWPRSLKCLNCGNQKIEISVKNRRRTSKRLERASCSGRQRLLTAGHPRQGPVKEPYN